MPTASTVESNVKSTMPATVITPKRVLLPTASLKIAEPPGMLISNERLKPTSLSSVLANVIGPAPFSVSTTLAVSSTASLKVIDEPSVAMFAPISVVPGISVVRDSNSPKPPTVPLKLVVPPALTNNVRSLAVESALSVPLKVTLTPVKTVLSPNVTAS